MLNNDLRSKIDAPWNAFWAGGIPTRSKSSSRSPACYGSLRHFTCPAAVTQAP